MEKWKICEEECLKYLKLNFSDKYYDFKGEGGSDSTKSDVLLTKSGIAIFYIETKMEQAQCGQFVAFPNEDEKSFYYSRSNLYPENLYSQLILEKMAENFDRYKNPSTNGIEVLMDKSYFYSWIFEFYKEKGVKYFITEKEVGNNNMSSDNFIIFPIEHFNRYFDVTAIYRKKKSGSANPTENNFDEIKRLASDEGFLVSEIYKQEKYTYVNMNAVCRTYKITGYKDTYQFKGVSENTFKVTKLSNTSNPNVIFLIKLVQAQQEIDLDLFKREFQ